MEDSPVKDKIYTPAGIQAYTAALKYAGICAGYCLHKITEAERLKALEELENAIANIPGASRPKARLET